MTDLWTKIVILSDGGTKLSDGKDERKGNQRGIGPTTT